MRAAAMFHCHFHGPAPIRPTTQWFGRERWQPTGAVRRVRHPRRPIRRPQGRVRLSLRWKVGNATILSSSGNKKISNYVVDTPYMIMTSYPRTHRYRLYVDMHLFHLAIGYCSFAGFAAFVWTELLLLSTAASVHPALMVHHLELSGRRLWCVIVIITAMHACVRTYVNVPAHTTLQNIYTQFM